MDNEVPMKDLLHKLMETGMIEPSITEICNTHYDDPLQTKTNCLRDKLIWELCDSGEELEYLKIIYANGILTTMYKINKTGRTIYHRSFNDMVAYLNQEFSELFDIVIKEPME